MTRKTIIFGNGLGMALNPTHFSLDHAIGRVWTDANLLDEACKQLICRCLPEERAGRPHGEAELDTLQMALFACDFLCSFPGSQIHWLSDEGQRFPKAVRKFIYNTALQFHQNQEMLPYTFLDPLCAFIAATNSHIATINYDNLLYQPLIEKGILQGYNGALVDGFFASGFKFENLNRKFERNFGYYLHLHGSPLFVDRDDNTYKLNKRDLTEQTDTVSSHIVLTHVAHKPTIITASDVLFSYWIKLRAAISESTELMIFGYSGTDAHLNEIINQFPSVATRVIEWDGSGGSEERSNYWNATLERQVALIQMPSILDFCDW